MSGQELMSYDDLYVKWNDLTQVAGPTVLGLAHNEMYYLPAWLAHYRKLGAQRFILLDDASTDDTLAFLRRQPDVMVVGSYRRFGDAVPVIDRTDPTGGTVQMRRMAHLWRMIMLERFSMNRWAVHVDLDEFIVLPEGASLTSVFAGLEDAAFDAVTGTMLDVYPRDMATLLRQKAEAGIDPSGTWYFDAQPHREARDGALHPVYPGARARLVHDFLTVPALPPVRRLRTRLGSWRRSLRGTYAYRTVNWFWKPCLMRWRAGAWLRNAHDTSLTISLRHQLPILHFKFTGDLYRRAEIAIRDKSYYNGSSGYMQLVALLAAMEHRGASFLYPNSAATTDLQAFRRANLLVGF